MGREIIEREDRERRTRENDGRARGVVETALEEKSFLYHKSEFFIYLLVVAVAMYMFAG